MSPKKKSWSAFRGVFTTFPIKRGFLWLMVIVQEKSISSIKKEKSRVTPTNGRGYFAENQDNLSLLQNHLIIQNS